MENGAFSEEAFAAWAKNFVLFCHITTQIAGEKYGQLLSEKGGGGFPYLTFMDAEGRIIGKHEGPRTISAFEESAARVKAFGDLKKKADEGDKAAALDFFLQAADIGYYTAQEAHERASALGELGAGDKKRVDDVLLLVDIRSVGRPRDKQAMAEQGKKFLDFKKAGRVPTKGDREVSTYWSCIMEYAYTQKDADLYEEGLKALKEHFGTRLPKKGVEGMEKILAELRAKGE